jgi:type VI secretion system protein ImpJ
MTIDWENKVIWQEGLFLQPQHLQQQDRYFERLIRNSTAGLTPFGYGLTELDINTDLLALGKFGVRSAVGILPDGTPFNIPRDIECPSPIDLPETLRNATIYLILPDRQPGAIETAPADMAETAARFYVAEHEAVDTNSGYQSVANVPIGRLRLRLAHEYESRAGYASLALARIVEVRPDRAAVLEETYIPPVLFFGVSGVLAGFGAQLQGLLHHRAEELSGRVSEAATRGAAPTSRGTADIADYLVLQICNHYELVITHLTASAGQIHPESLYRVLLGLAGELSTFTDGRKRPPVFPPYRHDDLSGTFRPIIASLRQYLSAVLERNAIPIPLQETRSGIRVGEITDSAIVTDCTWVLVVSAQVPPETLRRSFPNQVKIGPVEKIRDLITVALPGIAVSALPVVPRQLPYYAGRSYFEMDRTGPYWAALTNSAGIAIHVTGAIPGLEIECWAIRG